MDRRLSQRKFFDLDYDALLYHRELGELRCQVRDINLDGAFLEVAAATLPLNADVELVFNAPVQSQESEVIRFGARVIRCKDKGIGVSFNEYHDGAYQFLWQLIMA